MTPWWSEALAAIVAGAVTGVLMYRSGRVRGYNKGFRSGIASLRPPPSEDAQESFKKLDELFLTLNTVLEEHYRKNVELQRSVAELEKQLRAPKK